MLLISIAPIDCNALQHHDLLLRHPGLFPFRLLHPGLCEILFFVKIFDKYIPKDESEEEEKDEDDWTHRGTS